MLKHKSYRYQSNLVNDVLDTPRPLDCVPMNKKTKKKASDPVADQLRFEAQFYGDWYSESILSTYESDRAESDRSATPKPTTHSSASQHSPARARDTVGKSKH